MHTLTGVVTDEHDGEALEFATVFLEGAGLGATTAADGSFAFAVPCVDADTLLVSHVGCGSTRIALRGLTGRASAKLVIRLEHHAELLEGVEVHAHRNQTSAADVGGSLRGEQLDRSAGADLATALQALGGVRTLATGANVGRPLVDGLGGARLTIVQDGTALASQDWGDEHAPEIDPFAAASLQLARGGTSVRYGASTTGATIVVEDAGMPTEQALRGRALVTAGTNQAAVGSGLTLAQRLGTHWGYRAQAAASSAADARAPDYVLSNTGARRASALARVYYTDSTLDLSLGYRGFAQEMGILRAAHVGNLSDFERALTSADPLVIEPHTRTIGAPRQTVLHHWLSADATYHFTERRELRLAYSAQLNERQEYDIRRAGRGARPSVDLQLETHNLRTEYVPAAPGPWGGLYGVQAITAHNRNVAGTGVRPLIPYYDASTLGLYAERRRVSERRSLELAARADWRQTEARYFAQQAGEQGTQQVQFRRSDWLGGASVGLVERMGERHTLRARLAYASRSPNPAERFADGVHHALAVIERGDTSLRVEHGLKATLGYALAQGERYEVHVSGFAQAFRGFIYAAQQGAPELTVRGAFPVLVYRQSDALLAGLDLDAHATWDRWRVDVTLSTLSGRRAGGQPLPDIAPWRLQGGGSYGRGFAGRLKDLRLGSTVAYVGRQSRVPPGLLAAAPADYALVAAEVSGHVSWGRHVLGVHVSAQNLKNARYRDYLDRLRFYADRPGRDVQLRLLYDF